MLAAAVFAAFLKLGDVPRIAEAVTVTAPGSQRVAVTATATVLGRDALEASPSFTLDQKIGATPGFSLFRRASSRTANPTTQGVTLRGLSASGASRTLVMADDVPLNDPFGGWVYWNRVPAAAIERVEVVRGGSTDAFGGDALGGVIRIVTRRDTAAAMQVEGGNQGTGRLSLFGGLTRPVSASGGIERSTTHGYVPVAPESRGIVDTPAGSRHWSGQGRVGTDAGGTRVEGGGSFLAESRDNGTPVQINSTDVANGFLAAHGETLGGFWQARGFLQDQHYEQTFSFVQAGRAAERLTSAQAFDVRANGVDVSWSSGTTFLVTAFARNTTADEDVTAFRPDGSTSTNTGTLPEHFSGGAAAQLSMPLGGRATLSAGLRGERRTLEDLNHVLLFAPRVTVSYRALDGLVARLSAFSNYRAPTLNELFRGFRVGAIETLPEPALEPERARGAEVSVTLTRGRATIRAVAFATRLNGAIFSRTLRTSPGLVRIRSNGDGASRGLEVEADARMSRHARLWLSATAIDSTFTSGELDGNRLPQVPPAHASAGVVMTAGMLSGSLDLRYASRQFDDDRNQFELGSATTVNGQVSARVRHAQLFVAVENIFDADIDAGRTPLRTIGQPRVWQVGVRVFTR
ncbi:MAG: TonB-dependent receptor [Vicinamibacterales bacterium]